jgi:pentatricopeptide repeat protein
MEQMKDASKWFVDAGLELDDLCHEVLFRAYAQAEKMDEIKSLMASGAKPTAKAYATLIKNALKHKDVTLAGEFMERMQKSDFYVPAQFVMQLVRVCVEANRTQDALQLFDIELDC